MYANSCSLSSSKCQATWCRNTRFSSSAGTPVDWACGIFATTRYRPNSKRAIDTGTICYSSEAIQEAEISDHSDLSKDQCPSAYKGKIAVVVGAGPAGATAASYLARHGFKVKVFEGRGDLRIESAPIQRAYPIALSTETVEVLKDIGVNVPTDNKDHTSDLDAFIKSFIVRRDETFSVRDVPPDRVLGSRYDITNSIVNAVESHNSDQVRFYFGHVCKSVDLEEGTVEFEDRHRSRLTVEYDLLIGADGSNSAVRDAMASFDEDFHVKISPSLSTFISLGPFNPADNGTDSIRELLEQGSYTLSIPRMPRGGSLDDMGWTFFFPASDGNVYMLLAKRSQTFESKKLKIKQWADGVIPSLYPEMWRQEMLNALDHAPQASSFPSSIYVPKFTGPKTVLLGDAAHGISATHGFGCNLAITDGKALNEALYEAEGNIDEALSKYDQLRYSVVQSFLAIDEGRSFDRRARSVKEGIWRFACLSHRIVFLSLGKLLPKLFHNAETHEINDGQITAVDMHRRIVRESVLILCLLVGTFIWTLSRLVTSLLQHVAKSGLVL